MACGMHRPLFLLLCVFFFLVFSCLPLPDNWVGVVCWLWEG